MAKLGVYVGNESSAVADFESWLGQPVDAVLAYTGGASWSDADPGWQLSSQFLGGSGRELLWSLPMYPESGGVGMLREVAAGQHNSHYANWAQTILDSRAGDSEPIYVRTAWELGGEWFPWTGDAQEDPAAFRAAFQQFAETFHSVSDRFQIVWDVVPDRGPVEQWYPGDEAVDVISQDVYWQTQYVSSDPYEAFDTVVNGHEYGLAWIADFAAQHGKPIAISEWGVPGGSGFDGSTYIGLMKNWIDENNVLYATYWDSESAYDGKLSDNNPSDTASTLRNLYLNGIETSNPVPGSGGGNGGPIIDGGEGSGGSDGGSAGGGNTDGGSGGGSSGGGSSGGSSGGGSSGGSAGPTPPDSGRDTINIRATGDHFDGAPLMQVYADGVAIGDPIEISADRANGEWQDIEIQTSLPEGTETISVAFLNDNWDPENGDRNLYVDSVSVNGTDQGIKGDFYWSPQQASAPYTPSDDSDTIGGGSEDGASSGGSGEDNLGEEPATGGGSEGGDGETPPPGEPAPNTGTHNFDSGVELVDNLITTGAGVAWREDFDDGTGAFTNVWGQGVSVEDGQLIIRNAPDWSDSGAMLNPPGYGTPTGGNSYGVYTFRGMTDSDPGPYALIWPATNVWPGPELDMLEILPSGEGYSTIHWDENGENAYNSHTLTVDPTQWHTYQMVWEPGQLSMYVDGDLQWTDTEHVPLDAEDGGENLTMSFGMQNWWNIDEQNGDNFIAVEYAQYEPFPYA